RILAQRAQIVEIPRVALSPDGQQLAYIVEQAGKNRLEIADGRGHHAQVVKLAGGCRPEDLAWQPGTSALAVLTRCQVDPTNTKPIQSAIELLDTGGKHPARVLATLDGFAQALSWTHNGKRLGFLFVPGATRAPYATASGNPRVGVIGIEHVQVQRVAAIGLAGGNPELLTPAGLYAYEFSWSPDGKRIAYTAAPPPGDDNWWTAQLYVQDARAGATAKSIVDPATVSGSLHGLQIALPRWSPHGDIYFIGGLMSDRGATGGDIYRVAAKGGAPVDLTANTNATSSWFTFNGNGLLVSQIVRGKLRLQQFASSRSGELEPTKFGFTVPAVFGDGSAAMAVSLSADHNRVAFSMSSFTAPPEVHAGTLASAPPPAVTAFNAGQKQTWGKARSVEWNNGKTRVQGWLLYPANFNPRKSYPMIVYVHGGPTWANLPNWGTRAEAFSEFGYFVLLPNPRGSFGEGEAFTQAIRGQMGYGDLDDILAGVDAVEKIAPIDDARLGMLGWSYGGFMSMFAPTRTHRFRAVSAGAGIANWQSYYGQNLIDQWMIPFFGASVYDDPTAYAKSSAINFIKQTHTPALLLVGERDEECPAAQSFEYWHALKTLGVPTTLVVYANQGHHITGRKDQADILRRLLDWFGKYLGESPVLAPGNA
ncbi:MAG TPA: S9 family peptidase, partial [Rhodanobacteraceae bacterium]|nr:S9 family peptidase [Rhodanobacteraceae bacterium]